MKLYWVKTKWFIKRLFPGFVWDVQNDDKKVYLTFDDGPVPEVTDWVLSLLQQHNISATFFCIGDNIDKHPEVFKKVVSAGHAIGNHTYNHLNGWKTNDALYQENRLACEAAIGKYYLHADETKLFRPPYGKIKSAQAKALRNDGYKIIMWDVLSADFDQTITPEQCLQNVISSVQPGSIIIFHDSVKASVNLKYALPRVIEHLKKEGYTFDKLT